MKTKSKEWFAPYIDKRPATYADIIRCFPKEDQAVLRSLLDADYIKTMPKWTKRELQLMTALGWNTLDFRPQMLCAVFAYGFVKGCEYARQPDTTN